MTNKASTPTQAGPLALIATQPKSKGKTIESPSENIEEEFAMLMRKMRRFMKKKDFGRRFPNKRRTGNLQSRVLENLLGSRKTMTMKEMTCATTVSNLVTSEMTVQILQSEDITRRTGSKDTEGEKRLEPLQPRQRKEKKRLMQTELMIQISAALTVILQNLIMKR